jgi:hypothetical protein
MMRLKRKLDLVCLEIMLILMQFKCTVCSEHNTGLEILFRSIWRQFKCRCKIGARFAPNISSAQKSFWTHPIVLLGDEAQVEA